MNEIPAVYRLAFAIGFVFLAWYYGRREIVSENSPREIASANSPPVVQEASKPHPEPQPAAVSSPVDPTAESGSENESPVKETLPEPRPVPAPQPALRVVRVWAQDKLEIECHPNGSFLARGTIRRMPDGRWVQDGTWSNYWPKGTVSSVGEWKDGKQVGPWLFTSEDGCSTVTNEPPFASQLLVAQQTVPAAADGPVGSPGSPAVAAATAPDSVAVARRDDGPDANAGQTPGPASSTADTPSGRKTDPDLFVCGKHDSDPYLREADEWLMRGEWKRAKNAFSDYADQRLNAPERAYAMLQKAVCEERMGKLPEARAAYQDFLRVFGREECGAKGQAGLAALLWKQPSSRTQSIAEYEKLIKNYPTTPETASTLKVLGDYYLGQRDYAKARDCYEKFLANFPEAPGRQEVEAQAEAARLAGDCKGKTGGAAGLGFDEAVMPAEDLMTLGRYKEAIILYQELGRRFSGSPDSASYCLMQTGLCRFYLGQYAAAVECFEAVTTKYPGSGQTPRAYARCAVIADCYLNRPQEVERIAQKLARDYPDTFEAEQVHFVLGESKGPRVSKQWQQAYWSDFLRKWPNTVFRKTVSARLAALPVPSPGRINLGAAP